MPAQIQAMKMSKRRQIVSSVRFILLILFFSILCCYSIFFCPDITINDPFQSKKEGKRRDGSVRRQQGQGQKIFRQSLWLASPPPCLAAQILHQPSASRGDTNPSMRRTIRRCRERRRRIL